jgi:hypothetical protein
MAFVIAVIGGFDIYLTTLFNRAQRRAIDKTTANFSPAFN